jgi:amino acid adenylation domain-containing protein
VVTAAAAQPPRGFRLSPLQRRLWRLGGGEPATALRCRAVYELAGELAPRRLADALARVVARHEMLRTTFQRLPGMDLPVQVVAEPAAAPARLARLDLAALDPAARGRWLTGELAADGARFDFVHGPLLRACLAGAGPGEQWLRLELPALCGDPVALDRIAAELVEQCAGREHEPPMQYADVAEWQNQTLEAAESAEGVERWREIWRTQEIAARLARPLPLAAAGPAGGPAAATLAVPVVLPPAAERALAARLAADPAAGAAFLLACWQVLLARGAGDPEVLVGVLDEGRGYEELQSVVGPFARYLPLYRRLPAGEPLAALAVAAGRDLAAASAHQEHFGWEQMAASPAGSGEAEAGCFAAAFELWQPAPCLGAGRPALSPRRAAALIEGSTLALAVRLQSGAWELAMRADGRRLDSAALRLLAGRLEALVAAALAAPDAAWESLAMLPPAELALLAGLGVAAAPAPPASPAGGESTPAASIHRRFEQQAARTPERPALVADDESTTYGELNRRANRLAHHLRRLGAGAEQPVALLLGRSTAAVVALLAALKAGAAYVPLDPAHPRERLRLMLADAGCGLVLTESRLAGVLRAAAGEAGDAAEPRIVELDGEAEVIAACPDGDPAGPDLAGGLAYIIYTSGSSGRPKGVAVEHASPLALLAALDATVLAPLRRAGRPLRASLNAPLVFDASVQQLVLLLAGDTLHLVPEAARADGAALLAFLGERRLDLFDCTPSQLRLLVGGGGPAAAGLAGIPAAVLVAGEAIDERLWAALAASAGTVFYNIYGPTECTVDATWHRIAPGSGGPTIGRPLPGYEVHLLEPAAGGGLRPAPLGAPGELCIGGAGLARGYAGNPAATAERFVPRSAAGGAAGSRLYRTGDLARLRPGGELEFLGRLDQQVKVRGFRIELGEIEAALLAHPWVESAAAAAWPEPGGHELRLAAYLVAAAAAPVRPPRLAADVRRHAAARLPAYMVPGTFDVLAALPRLASGKLDRRALPRPVPQRAAGGELFVAPRNPVEEILAGTWCELLRLPVVGVHDDFFDVGGHSLLATQLISRVRDLFEVDVKVRSLFETPTVAGLAEAVSAARAAGAAALPPLRPAARGARAPLSYSQQRLWLQHQLEPASTAYALPLGVRLRGALDVPAMAAGLAEIVRRHEALRTTFAAPDESDGEPAQVVAAAAAGPALPLLDLAELGPAAAGWAQRLLAGEVRRPFDLGRGPLLRARLVRLAAADHVLALTLHHIVSDAWSIGVLMRELATLYAAFVLRRPSPLPPLPVQYADYALWQRSWLTRERLEQELAYWRGQLAGAPELLRLRGELPRPATPSRRAGARFFTLPTALGERLRELARAEGATLFMVLLAAFKALLRHLQALDGVDDVVVGSPVSYRNWGEIEGLIGFFVNTLPLRSSLAGDPSFAELLARVRRTALDGFAHQHLPFDRMVAELRPRRSTEHAALFQAGFTFQAAGDEDLRLPELAATSFGIAVETAQFDLNLSVTDAPAVQCAFQYASELYAAATVDLWAELFETLLAAVAERPQARLSELRTTLAAAERRFWSAGGTPEPEASQGFRQRRRQAVSALPGEQGRA